MPEYVPTNEPLFLNSYLVAGNSRLAYEDALIYTEPHGDRVSTFDSTLQGGPTRQAAEAAVRELSWLRRYVVLFIVCVGVFMNTLDTGITDILNPVFVSQFHVNLYEEYWIELSYAIPLIGMLLPAGHLGDRLGRKNVFLTGVILFGGGSGLLTLMPTFEA